MIEFEQHFMIRINPIAQIYIILTDKHEMAGHRKAYIFSLSAFGRAVPTHFCKKSIWVQVSLLHITELK